MTIPEMMTIVVLFHQSDYRTFKYFYMYVQQNLYREFPKLLSYERFLVQMKNLFIPLFSYLLYIKGQVTGIFLSIPLLSKFVIVNEFPKIKYSKALPDAEKLPQVGFMVSNYI
jgi:hypothetical protein